MRSRLTVDCFKFYNEFKRLELRLNILDPVVDYFVLVEATVSHSGSQKPLYFDLSRKRFEKWARKIIHVIVRDMPLATSDNYERDRHQLNCILRGLAVPRLKPDDVVIVGDLDEIPNPEAIRAYRPSMGIMGLKCYNAFFYINTEAYTVSWYNPKIGTKLIAKLYSPVGMRDFDCLANGAFFENGGWHFSYCGGVMDFLHKVTHYSHSRQIPNAWRDPKTIRWIMDDPAARAESFIGHPLRMRKIDNSFPEYVQTHVKELRDKGLIWSP